MPQPKPKKTPGPKPERLKIELEPEQALARLLAPKQKAPRRKSGSK